MGIEAIYFKPRTSIVDKTHRINPYLLRDLANTRADQVWCTDITYIPMPRGDGLAHALRAGMGGVVDQAIPKRLRTRTGATSMANLLSRISYAGTHCAFTALENPA
jgi:hypothetical protein